jgi:hypothetical protein
LLARAGTREEGKGVVDALLGVVAGALNDLRHLLGGEDRLLLLHPTPPQIGGHGRWPDVMVLGGKGE